ncbi:YSC84-related protein [Maribacter halichondriae]|uniref:lipid-binding SYLF domain-containing protein n=1 Tax=Maribacter halichondriae TaxID=2980554 RepID=UPI002358409C|nr:YSC84-related protein [Maribacter sp. Hal144]
MKTLKFKKLKIATTLLCVVCSLTMSAQIGGWNPELENDAEEALQTMLEKTSKLESFRDAAYGYAVFPRVTKAGAAIGGAIGNGIVYKDNAIVGSSKLRQASFGLQIGGQQYIEVIFFENETSFNHFTNGKLKFDAQASAVLLKEGASVDVAYHEGVAVFSSTIGGVMAEASIGGQHFKYEPKENE